MSQLGTGPPTGRDKKFRQVQKNVAHIRRDSGTPLMQMQVELSELLVELLAEIYDKLVEMDSPSPF